MLAYISNRFDSILKHYNLNNFDALWSYAIDWFEEPNVRRGGWSGVGRVELKTDNTDTTAYFVKKQQNHGRRTFRNPINGEPTFRREFKRLKFLESHNFAAPHVVFYEESSKDPEPKAILVTEALDGYIPLDEMLDTWYQSASRTEKQKLIKAVALEVRRFHDLGLVHRAMYPKHLFIQNAEDQIKIAVIDLEKARFSSFSYYRTYFDLAALNRHTSYLRHTERLQFFIYYSQLNKLSYLNKLLCRLIIRRSMR